MCDQHNDVAPEDPETSWNSSSSSEDTEDDELQIVKIITRQVPQKNSSSGASDVRSGAFRESEENVFRKKAQLAIAMQERQLKEAAEIMKAQQKALLDAESERDEMRELLEKEKKVIVEVERKLKEIKETVNSVVRIICEESCESQMADYNDTSDRVHLTDYTELKNQLNYFTSGILSKLEKLRVDQNERKVVVSRTSGKVEKLLKTISTNIKVFQTSSKAPKTENLEAPNTTKRRKASKAIQNLRLKRPNLRIRRGGTKWMASAINYDNTNKRPTRITRKHFRDITKRHQGYYCICGVRKVSRKDLDSHIQRFGFNYTEPETTHLFDDEVKFKDEKSKLPGTGKRSLRCQVCGLKFRNQQSLHLHRFGRKFSCSICGRKEIGTWELKRHYQTCHQISHAIVGIGCWKCGNTFRNRQELLRHQRNANCSNCKCKSEQTKSS